MEYRLTPRGIELEAGAGFNLGSTFNCGQCFRWDEDENGGYCGIVGEHELRIFDDNGTIVLENVPEQEFLSLWLKYFDLETDYEGIRLTLAERCPQLKCAIDSINGIRILSQEPWEALCSFIISQNNNIPRIKGIIDRLCRSFGKPCGSHYTFPSASDLKDRSPEELAPLRAGFRAGYIIDAARRVASGEVRLEEMFSAPLEQCRRELMTIKGVGVKVAECTLLYGLHRLDAFPVDVWMKKALSSSFSGVDPGMLSPYAGVAQQYIFHYIRNTEPLAAAE